MPLSEDQLAARKIGSSDAALACGLQVFGRTRFELWEELTGRAQRPELGNLRRIRRGNYLEAFAAEEYEHEMGTVLRRDNLTRSPKKFPWMTAHIDRRVTGAHKLVECKAPGPYTRGYGEAGTDEVPEYVLLQVVHQCICMGAKWTGDVAAIMGEDFRVYPIEIPKALRERVIDLEREFWGYVERDEAPPVQTISDANKAWGTDLPKRIYATKEIAHACRMLNAAKMSKKIDEKAIERWTLKIMQYMTHNEMLVDDEGEKLVTWRKPKDSTKTDWKAVAQAMFDAYHEARYKLAMNEYADVPEDFERHCAQVFVEAVNGNTETKENTRRFLLK